MTHKKWDKMTDVQRWKWVKKHADECTVHCDNDDTFMTINALSNHPEVLSGDRDEPYFQFDWYIGWANGIFELANALGLPLEAV
jgi:hypothetical protein